MDFYPWVVLTHVVSAFVFILAHGVSAFVAFRLRGEGDRARLTAVLDLSASSLPIMYAALLVALVSGIAAAIMGGHFEKLWPWAAIGVFLAVGIAMTPLGTFPLAAIRRGLGQPNRDDQKKGVVPEPVPDAELATLRAKVRPELLAAIGLSGLVAMIWLMEAKPF